MKNLMKTLMVAVMAFAFMGTAVAEVKVGGYKLNEPFKPFGVEQYTNYNERIYSVPLDKSANKTEKKYFTTANVPMNPLAPDTIATKGTMKDAKACENAFKEMKAENLANYGESGLKYSEEKRKGMGSIYLYTSGMFMKDNHVYASKLACLTENDGVNGIVHRLYHEIDTKQ